MIVLSMESLRQRLAYNMGDLTVGSATSDPAVGATLVDTKRIEADDHWNNHFIKIGEDGNREFLRVSDFVNSTNTLTVVPDMAVDHANGVTYELTEMFSMLEYQRFLEMGILEMATWNVLSNLSYTGMTLAQDDWEYPIPNNFRYISEVTIAESDGTYRESGRVPLGDLDVVPGDIPQLRFAECIPITADRAVRVRGQGEQLLPTNFDTSELEIDPAFVLMNAEMRAHMVLASRLRGDSANVHAQLARNLLTPVENQRDLASAEHRPKPGSLVVG